MNEQVELSESMENYLEVILDLEKTNKVARAKDIADQLDLQPGTVTGALKVLKEKGLINYSPYSFITLTAEGTKIAKLIHRRHQVLNDFLQHVLQIETTESVSIAADYLDGDGHVDLVLSGDPLVTILFGDGSGGFDRHIQAPGGP